MLTAAYAGNTTVTVSAAVSEPLLVQPAVHTAVHTAVRTAIHTQPCTQPYTHSRALERRRSVRADCSMGGGRCRVLGGDGSTRRRGIRRRHARNTATEYGDGIRRRHTHGVGVGVGVGVGRCRQRTWRRGISAGSSRTAAGSAAAAAPANACLAYSCSRDLHRDCSCRSGLASLLAGGSAASPAYSRRRREFRQF